MTWDEAMAWLFSLEKRGIKLDLGRMRDCLEDLGRPQDAFPSILIAGTNGKGSTSATLASVLGQAGRKVGLFTSPHLLDYRERIRLDGALAPKEAILRRIEEDRGVWERHSLSFFEATAALALSLFRESGVGVAVLEVGLGGRLDATNTVEPVLSVITPLGMDHANLLGSTAAAIAGEKAGILRPGVPVAVGGGPREALAAVRQRAAELGSPFFLRRSCLRVDEIRPEHRPEGHNLEDHGFPGHSVRFRVRRREGAPAGFRLPEAGLECRSRLTGAHQVGNSALAVLALTLLRERGLPGLVVQDEEIRHGVERLHWPGRMERPLPGAPLLADVAHNREGARVLVRHLLPLSHRREIRPVVGMLVNKDHEGFFRDIRRLSGGIRLVPLQAERAADMDGLLAAARSAGLEPQVFESVAAGLRDAMESAFEPDGPLVLLCGSFHTLEEGYHSLGVEASEHLWQA